MADYTPFTYTDKIIDQSTLDQLNQIVINKTEDFDKGILDSFMNKHNKTVCVPVSLKSDSTKTVQNVAKIFFEKSGLDVNMNSNGYITYISYDYNNSEDVSYDDLVENIYKANEGFAGVHECIIITEKGDNLKQGDMEVYTKYPNSFLTIIGYDKEETDVYELQTGTVMVFNGDTFHKLQSFSGNGRFNFIIVTMYSSQYDSD